MNYSKYSTMELLLHAKFTLFIRINSDLFVTVITFILKLFRYFPVDHIQW